jgi:Flp pilus assembly protein TadB
MREEQSEDKGSSLGFLVKLALVVGLILLAISVFVHVLHLLFLIAVIWFIGFVGVAAYRLGRRRGP